MQKNIECPVCDHQFCFKCLKIAWTKPVGEGSLSGRGYHGDVQLTCCACGVMNLGEQWHEVRVPEHKQNLEKNQMDFFK